MSRDLCGRAIIVSAGESNARSSHVSVHARIWRDVFVAGDENTYFELGDIAAGKFVEFAFLVYTGASMKQGENIPVTIYLNEARPQFGVVSPLMLHVDVPLSSNTDAGVSGDK